MLLTGQNRWIDLSSHLEGRSEKTNDCLDERRNEMAVKYTLVRECLDNVEDNAGRWQIDGGKVMQRQKHVANYSSVKRVSCGTHEQNTAMVWMTLFFLKGKPPENMTLHGAHDFNSGGQIGSVSAASSAFASRIGKRFKRVGDTLTIG
jgi:hypothetical protein